MYVCICHAINERKVHAALDGGARSAGQVFRSHGCSPQCGKCVPLMRQMIETRRVGESCRDGCDGHCRDAQADRTLPANDEAAINEAAYAIAAE